MGGAEAQDEPHNEFYLASARWGRDAFLFRRITWKAMSKSMFRSRTFKNPWRRELFVDVVV